MRRKGISVVVAIGLLLAIPSISQGASAKLGAKCTKLNSISGSLVCKKTGNKLTWQKRVTAKPTSAPTASPTPTPTPTPEPTAPSSPITFDNLDTKWTASIARQNLTNELARLNQPKSAAIYHVGPTVKEDLYIEEKRLLVIAEKMFSNYYTPTSFDVLMFQYHSLRA
jgi:hypothetical protein